MFKGVKKILKRKKASSYYKHIERPTSERELLETSHSLMEASFTIHFFCANHFYVLKHHECFMYCRVFCFFGAWISLFSIHRIQVVLTKYVVELASYRNMKLGVRHLSISTFSVCRFPIFPYYQGIKTKEITSLKKAGECEKTIN